MKYSTQVTKDHYFVDEYIDENRWNSYYNQIESVRKVSKMLGKNNVTVLEIGIGNGLVEDILKKIGFSVTTLDIDKNLNPDIVASLPDIKLSRKYDCILACEVLEHIKFEDVERSFKSFSKISDYLIISVPDKSPYVSFIIKLPLILAKGFLPSFPFNHTPLKFNGEHYWELGTNGISSNRFKKAAEKSGYECISSFRVRINPWHHFFIFTKIPKKPK